MIPRARSVGILLLITAVQAGVAAWMHSQALADPLLQVAPLDQERVRPSLKGKIPPFPPAPGTRRFALFNNVATLQPPRLVYMRVPEEFAGPDTSDPTRVWGSIYWSITRYDWTTQSSEGWQARRLSGRLPRRNADHNQIGLHFFGAESRLQALQKFARNATTGLARYSEIVRPGFSKVIREEYGANPRNVSDMLHFIKMKIPPTYRFMRTAITTRRCICVRPMRICRRSAALRWTIQYAWRRSITGSAFNMTSSLS